MEGNQESVKILSLRIWQLVERGALPPVINRSEAAEDKTT